MQQEGRNDSENQGSRNYQSQSGYNYKEETSSEPLLLPSPQGTTTMQTGTGLTATGSTATNSTGTGSNETGSTASRSALTGTAGSSPAENTREETAGEIAAPVQVRQNRNNKEGQQRNQADENAGTSMLGYIALGLAILSLFFLPVLLGAAGIVLGFLAMRRGQSKAGGWAIGIGAVSLIIGMFIAPFF
ncbi:hypothetical protein A8F94_04510 [Bacillus sp. FJAT-27225]|nr:hypothetical protein A8F94_04510 [Bacillus sp. FJAT-27225]